MKCNLMSNIYIYIYNSSKISYTNYENLSMLLVDLGIEVFWVTWDRKCGGYNTVKHIHLTFKIVFVDDFL